MLTSIIYDYLEITITITMTITIMLTISPALGARTRPGQTFAILFVTIGSILFVIIYSILFVS